MITKDPFVSPRYVNYQRYGYTDNRCALRGGWDEFASDTEAMRPSSLERLCWRRTVPAVALNSLVSYSFRVCRTVRQPDLTEIGE